MPARLDPEGACCVHVTRDDALCAQGTFCLLSLIRRMGALLPPVQRSITPMGAETASLCSNLRLGGQSYPSGFTGKCLFFKCSGTRSVCSDSISSVAAPNDS